MITFLSSKDGKPISTKETQDWVMKHECNIFCVYGDGHITISSKGDGHSERPNSHQTHQ